MEIFFPIEFLKEEKFIYIKLDKLIYSPLQESFQWKG